MCIQIYLSVCWVGGSSKRLCVHLRANVCVCVCPVQANVNALEVGGIGYWAHGESEAIASILSHSCLLHHPLHTTEGPLFTSTGTKPRCVYKMQGHRVMIRQQGFSKRLERPDNPATTRFTLYFSALIKFSGAKDRHRQSGKAAVNQ